MKRLIAFFAAVLAVLPLSAAMRTWTGTSGTLWSNAANWGGTAPVAGDDLVFPATGINISNNNDLPAGTSYNSITFLGATTSYTLSGNAVTIGAGGVTNQAKNPAVSLAVTLAAPATFQNDGGVMTFGAVALNGQTLTLTGATGSPEIDGIVSGSGGIVMNGQNNWFLKGSNTFTGQIQVNSGTLTAFSVNAFGAADDTLANGTVVNAGGQLALVPPNTYPTERIVVNGTGSLSSNGALAIFGSGNVTLTGTVVLGTSVGMNFGVNSVTFNGVVTGSGRLGMGGNGAFVLGNAGNDFTGGVQWGAAGTSDSTLALNANNTLPAGVSLAIGLNGTFNVNSKTQSIASLSGSGNVDLGSGTPGNLTITSPPNVNYNGSIGGTGNVTLTGGNVTLTGTHVFTGTLANAGGILQLSGGSITAPVTQSTGTLGLSSSQTTADITLNGGSVVPGLGGSATAFTGNLTLAPAASYSELIVGTSAGLFGALHVTGTINLGGAALTLSGTGGGVVNGTQLTILDNDGSDAVTGTFNGLPQGATISGGPGGFNYVISYTGGTGNDVVLTAVSSVLPTTSTTVSSGTNPSNFGTSVTFTSHVTSGSPGTPTGTVTFIADGNSIGTGPLSGGTATFSTSALAAGQHIMSASYGGDANFNGSTSTVFTQTVKAITTTTVGSSLNPSTPGASVTFTAHVTTTATPTAPVSFFDGVTLLGSASVTGGIATFSTSALTAGPHNITASFSGDTFNTASTSPILVQNVTAVAATGVPALDGRALIALAVILAAIAGRALKG